MEMERCSSLVFLLLAFLSSQARASHFRGGTISWAYLGQSGNDYNVEINFRLGWRLDSSTPRCSASTIQSQAESYANGNWRSSGSGLLLYYSTNETTAIRCTTLEAAENWAYGYNSFVITVSVSGPFHMSYTGNAWVSGALYASGSWALTAGNIDLATRSDTGLVNNPPTTFTSPVVRLIQGCAQTIAIPHQDVDNDKVSCRYALSGQTPDECDGACNGGSGIGYTHFTLNETACTIHYDGSGATALVAVTLVLEDYPRSTIVLGGSRTKTPSDYLSQIPLQFFMEIDQMSACNVEPTYPSQTIQENDQIVVPSGGGMNASIYAYPSSASTTVTNFVILGPLGMQSSQVISLANNLYSSNLLWSPTASQGGPHNVCYYAVDSGGNIGKQVCFQANVATVDPCSQDNGGCSDICTFSGVSRTCSCSVSCWSLDLDGATCVPDMTVTCDGESMTISAADCASNKTIVVGNSPQDIVKSECQSSHIGNRHELNVNASTCGLSYQVNPVQVQYVGTMWAWHEIDTGSAIITRGSYRNIPVTCVLPTSSKVSASFVPELPFNNESFPVEKSVPGIGEFSLFFEFYRSSAYSSVVPANEYPISVRVNDRFYFAIGAIGLQGFTMLTQECDAVTSDPDPTQPPLSYQFLRNGCILDPTVTRLPSVNDLEDRLSMQAFDFAQKITSARDDADISLECKVMICDASNSTSRCFQGCVSSRKKRSFFERFKRETGDDDDDDDNDDNEGPVTAESPLLDLRGRFILVADPDTLDTMTDSSPNYLNWALLAIGVLLLLVVLYIGHRFLQSRRIESQTRFSNDNPSGHWNKAADIDSYLHKM